MSMTDIQDAEAVRRKVRDGYGEIAKSGGSCCGSRTSGCGATAAGTEDLARHVGYAAEELAALPEGANMGLSCGNPNALALLKQGEVVLDLGSGGGFDAFIAGRKVGAAGLADIALNPKATYVDGMVDWQDPLYQKILASLPAGTKAGDYITSLEVTARKPGAGCCGDDCCGSGEPADKGAATRE